MNHKPLAREGQFLTFTLNQQVFGIPIEVVREINQLPAITPIPNAPLCVAGVINLRDKVVPVVDLRRKFKLAEKSNSRDTCVIVVDGRQGQVAAIVDTVASVVPLRAEQIEAVPALIQDEDNAPIIGLGKIDQKVVVLLNIAQIVDHDSVHEALELDALIPQHHRAVPA